MEITARQLEIIEAAGEILTKSGVNGLTTKNLAALIGFSESALYRHFKSKEEIILTMLLYLAEDMDIRLRLVVKVDNDPKKKLNALFNSQFDFFQKNPHFLIAMLSDGLFEESAAINKAIKKIMETAMKQLLPIIELGQQQHIFNRDLTAEALCHFIMGSFRLHILKWRLSGLSFDVKQVGNERMKDLFLLISSQKNTP